ncbi:hypothetical protein HDU97_003120 [Phlyctochytrium planicorne]|nr:hypothetical protein HDU97_003071 [Phlyctochytrium planicorne]KAJ3109691.1 hypothetical protein HDU97_003120 [Phlyctochytrium planicorne]
MSSTMNLAVFLTLTTTYLIPSIQAAAEPYPPNCYVSLPTIEHLIGGTPLRRKAYLGYSKDIGSEVFYQYTPYVTDPREGSHTNESYVITSGLLYLENTALYSTGSLFTHYGHCITVGDGITTNSSRLYVQQCVKNLKSQQFYYDYQNQFDWRLLRSAANLSLYVTSPSEYEGPAELLPHHLRPHSQHSKGSGSVRSRFYLNKYKNHNHKKNNLNYAQDRY